MNDKEIRNRYRDWLPTAFKLGLFSCLRLDELVNLKYCDIIENKEVSYLEAANTKVNKLLGINNRNNKRIKRIPIIKQMWDVLNQECDYQQNKGTNRYIIASDLSRSTTKDIIGKGFTHYKRIAGIVETKCFKELRKTFINALNTKSGSDVTAIVSDHSSKVVFDKHYINQLDAIKKTQEIKIFE